MPRRTEPEPYAAKVGARVRALRTEQNMSLSDLASGSDVRKGHISTIERGFAGITIQTITRLAKGLGVPPLYLMLFAADDERDAVM